MFSMQGMCRRVLAAVALAVIGMCGVAVSQAASNGAAPGSGVTFTLDFPESEPAHYSLQWMRMGMRSMSAW